MSGSNDDAVMVPRAEYDIALRSQTLLNRLLSNPKHARAVEDAVLAENPNAKFPGRDAREAALEPVRAEMEAERTKREALEARLTAREEKEAAADQKREEDAMLTRISAVRSKRGFSDEMMDKVVARMRDQNNPDIDAAAAWVAESLPKPGPATGYDYLPSTVDAYGVASQDEAWKGLHQNPEQWQTKELRDIVRDPEFLRLGNQ